MKCEYCGRENAIDPGNMIFMCDIGTGCRNDSLRQDDAAGIENHPMFEAFIRAFWRRIEPYKNEYDKELPEKMPVEFKASMTTAFLTFDLKNISTDEK